MADREVLLPKLNVRSFSGRQTQKEDFYLLGLVRVFLVSFIIRTISALFGTLLL